MLANYSAQRAFNVDLTAGSWAPILVDPPFQTLHDPSTGEMKPGLDWGDIISIAKPAKPTIAKADRIKMCRPTPWMYANLYVYITYVDPGTQELTAQLIEMAGGSSNTSFEYTEDGFILHQNAGLAGAIDFNTTAGVVYIVHGPIAQIVLAADTAYNGGPEAAAEYPDVVSWNTPQTTGFSSALTYPITMADFGTDGATPTSIERYVYGKMSLVDFSMPIIEQQVKTEVDVSDYNLTDSIWEASFKFQIEYVRGGRQFAYYLQSHVDKAICYGKYDTTSTTSVIKLKAPLSTTTTVPTTGKLRHGSIGTVMSYTSWSYNGTTELYSFVLSTTTSTYTEDDEIEVVDMTFDGGREGPPSDVSDLVSVDPGEILFVQTELESTGCMATRIYRSDTGAEGSFRLLSDDASSGTDAKFIDTFLLPLTEELPPYGNYPHASKTAALNHSLYHPAQFGVLYYGSTLYLSDIFRPWAYPEEWTVAFPQTILAAAISGNSIIVLCDGDAQNEGRVYSLAGNDPKYLASYEISNAHPLLNKCGLAKIGQRVYWPTYDGVAMTTGNEIEVVTEKFFTREEWNDELPSLMSSYTAENTLFIINNGRNWRMDFDEMAGEPFTFLTTFSAYSKEEFLWESKIFDYDRPMCWSHIKVDAVEYPIAVEIFDGAGLQHAAMLINDDKIRRLPRMRRERDWYLRIHGYHETTFVGVATSAEELL
jgi:hypothetical protein